MNYFKKNGILKQQITFSDYQQEKLTRIITLDKLGNTRWKFIGYQVSKTVSINEFSDLDLVENLVKKIGADLRQIGWPINSLMSYFYYSKEISDIKPELIKRSHPKCF